MINGTQTSMAGSAMALCPVLSNLPECGAPQVSAPLRLRLLSISCIPVSLATQQHLQGLSGIELFLDSFPGDASRSLCEKFLAECSRPAAS